MKKFKLICFARDFGNYAVCSALISDDINKFIVPQLREKDEYYIDEEEGYIEIHDNINRFIVPNNIIKVDLAEWSDYYDEYCITAKNSDGKDIDFSLSGKILD